MTERYLCIHGHFYQPPRENPWLEHVERQEAAKPYHDWNERITAECYAPNAAARILDEAGQIGAIRNNYQRMSFNFGPTLLSWMQRCAPETYAAVLDADRSSFERFSGHGSAIAQVYNHIIMPLASLRDKVTQVRWGIRDFESRFVRKPEGMWLAETAVDIESLEVLAENEIAFTILAPSQASRVRELGGGNWTDTSGGRIDPRRAYVANLPSGKSIALFFYDGPISRSVAFEGDLLKDGVRFANRLVAVYSEEGEGAQLAHIANDGETFGHHHRHGEMALAYALHHIESSGLARITNYGEFLERFPPTYEVEIIENTSWSCAHGVERWRSDCGCNIGQFPDGNQAWRRPLRISLDWLRDEVAAVFEHAADMLTDPWRARDAFIDVVLDRSRQSVDSFFAGQAARDLRPEEQQTALQLLEMQRHAMLMFTSCGWFFDDLTRVETVQILSYAARAIQLAERLGAEDLESTFLERLAFAASNIPERGNGRQVFTDQVKRKTVDLEKVGAHYAIRSLFEPDRERGRVYCYQVVRRDYREARAGMAKLSTGKLAVTSEITREKQELCFAILHFGDHTINGGVHPLRDEQAYTTLVREVTKAFRVADLTQVLRLLDGHYQGLKYSIGALFRDEQRRILDLVLERTLEDAEAKYRQIYEQHAPLMRLLHQIDMPAPPAIQEAGEMFLNKQLRVAFDADDPDLELIHRLLDEARGTAVELDEEALGYTASRTMERGMRRLAARQGDLGVAQSLRDAATTVAALRFEVDLRAAQNIYYTQILRRLPDYGENAKRGEVHGRKWAETVLALGGALGFRVENEQD